MDGSCSTGIERAKVQFFSTAMRGAFNQNAPPINQYVHDTFKLVEYKSGWSDAAGHSAPDLLQRAMGATSRLPLSQLVECVECQTLAFDPAGRPWLASGLPAGTRAKVPSSPDLHACPAALVCDNNKQRYQPEGAIYDRRAEAPFDPTRRF